MFEAAQAVNNEKSVLDLVQTITGVAALLAAAFSIYLQRREMAASAKLNAAATLFDYYNAKIASLRRSIVRDGGSANDARLQSMNERQQRLKKLLADHEALLQDLESLYSRAR